MKKPRDMTGTAYCLECRSHAVHEGGRPGTPLVIRHRPTCSMAPLRPVAQIAYPTDREPVTARSCAIDLEVTLAHCVLPGHPADWARGAVLSSDHGWPRGDSRWTDEGVLEVFRVNEYGDLVRVRITVEVLEP